jgi:hypothetical protein
MDAASITSGGRDRHPESMPKEHEVEVLERLADGQAAVFEPGLNSLPSRKRCLGLRHQVTRSSKSERHVLPHPLSTSSGRRSEIVVYPNWSSRTRLQSRSLVSFARLMAGSPGDIDSGRSDASRRSRHGSGPPPSFWARQSAELCNRAALGLRHSPSSAPS